MSMTRPHQAPTGVWLPLVTPFAQGQLDEPSLRRLVYHYSPTGISGFVLGATTGESYALYTEEKQRIIMVAQEANERHLPVYLGLGGSHTHDMLCKIQRANDWDINGFLVTTPHCVKPTQEGLLQHYWQLADASRHPILIYNIPYRTWTNMENDTVLRLAQHPNIVGIKDCCGNREQSLDLIARKPEGFSVLIGDDDKFFDYVNLGADGGILASAHIEPSRYAGTFTAIKSNQSESVRDFWNSFEPNIPMIFKESPNPGPLKLLLADRGMIQSGELRLPLTQPTPPSAQKIKAAFAFSSFA